MGIYTIRREKSLDELSHGERRETISDDTRQIDSYKDQLLKLIPGETVTLYAISSGLIENKENNILDIHKYNWFLALFIGCLSLTFLIRFVEARDPKTNKPQWGNILASCVSFIIYGYTLGGPFKYFSPIWLSGWKQFIGTIISGFWTVTLPYIAKAATLIQRGGPSPKKSVI